MKGLLLLIGVFAALTAVPAASGKGLPPSKICGAAKCVNLDGGPRSVIILDFDSRSPAPPVTGYYRVEYAEPGVGQHLFVPSRSRLAVPTAGGRALQWYALYGTGPEHLLRAVEKLEPYPPPVAWPDSVEAVTAIFDGPAPDREFDLRTWIFGASLVALACAALLARRFTLRGPRTA